MKKMACLLTFVQKPSFILFLPNSEKRELWEAVFKVYLNRGNNNDEFDNKMLISRIASLRVSRANLLGYKTHADAFQAFKETDPFNTELAASFRKNVLSMGSNDTMAHHLKFRGSEPKVDALLKRRGLD